MDNRLSYADGVCAGSTRASYAHRPLDLLYVIHLVVDEQCNVEPRWYWTGGNLDTIQHWYFDSAVMDPRYTGPYLDGSFSGDECRTTVQATFLGNPLYNYAPDHTHTPTVRGTATTSTVTCHLLSESPYYVVDPESYWRVTHACATRDAVTEAPPVPLTAADQVFSTVAAGSIGVFDVSLPT